MTTPPLTSSKPKTALVHAAVVRGRPGLVLEPVSLVVRRRQWVAASLVIAVVAGLLVLSVSTGTLAVSAERIWAAITGNGTTIENLIVLKNRLPRALTAALAGFAFGAAGAITQSLTRNALASPDILGVSAGASLFAVAAIVLPSMGGTGSTTLASVTDAGSFLAGPATVPIAAFLGGLTITALIVGLAWRGGVDGLRLIMAGIGINALALAATSWLLIRAELADASVATRWLTGSVSSVSWQEIQVLAIIAGAGALACIPALRSLASLRLGNDLTVALGGRVARSQTLVLLIAVGLVAAATSVTGPIGFIAFVAPQIALRIFKTTGPSPLSAGIWGQPWY